MSESKKYKHDHPVAFALNFGELEALKALLNKYVPLPDPDDSEESTTPTTISGRLRIYLMAQCRAESIPIRLSSTGRLPSFPRHPGTFKTLAQEKEYHRIYRQVWERRQELIDASPEIQAQKEVRARVVQEQEDARLRIIESNQVDFIEEIINKSKPTPNDPSIGVKDVPTVQDNQVECWCSNPFDPEVHSLHLFPSDD